MATDTGQGVNDEADGLGGAAPRARTRDATETRRRILAAAQRHFSRRGYAHVGLRDIAAEAQADVSLVARYFGSKECLFETALSASIDTSDLWSRPKAEVGRNIVALFVEEQDRALYPLAMFMQAAADPTAKAVTVALIRDRIMGPMAQWLGAPDAEGRAARILALCAGFYAYRVMLPLDPFGGDVAPATKAWLEQTIQALVDGTSEVDL